MTDERGDDVLSVLRDRLCEEREHLLAERDASGGDRKPVALDQQSVGRLSRMDAMQVQAMAKAVDSRRRAAIQQIDAALARMDDGSFGECIECGETIARKRLELDPKTALCIRCAS